MTQQTINLGYAVWGGGPGDLSGTNWIVGYVDNIGTNNIVSFVSWVYGQPNTESTIEFLPSLTALGVINSTVGSGGMLTGNLTTDTAIIDSGAAYSMTGDLSVEYAYVELGTLSIATGGTLSAGRNTLVQGGTLAISGDGSTLNVIQTLLVGGNSGPASLEISNGGFAGAAEIDIGSNGGAATVSVSGTGSELTFGGGLFVPGLLVEYGSFVTITNGASVIGGGDVYVGSENIIGSNSAGTLSVDGIGSTLTALAYLYISSAGSLIISDGGAATVADDVDVIAGAITVTGVDSILNTNSLEFGDGTLLVTDGGTVSASTDSTVGGEVLDGTITVDGVGSSLEADFLDIGNFGNASLTVSNAGSVSVSGDTFVGYFSSATITVTDVDSVLTTDIIRLGLDGGGEQSAYLNILNGATVSVAEYLQASDDTGNGGGAPAFMTIDGDDSLLEVGDLYLAPSSTATITISDGTIIANSITLYGSSTDGTGGVITGTGTIDGAIQNDNTIVAKDGTLTLTQKVTDRGTLAVGSSGDLILGDQIASTQTVTFLDGSGILTIGDFGSFTSPIYSFQEGDVIDVENVIANTVAYDSKIGKFLLEEQSAGQPVSVVGTLDLADLGPGTSLNAENDGDGGTDVTVGTTTLQEVDFGYAVWGGGSGDLSSFNWITGYVENVTNGKAPSFVGWIHGAAPVNSSLLSFQSTLEALEEVNAEVGEGGTVSGNLSTTDDLNFGLASGSTDVLSGNLTVSDADITSGDLTVDGNTADLSIGGLLKVEGGQLSVDDGGVVSAFAGAYVGYDESNGETTVTSTAALTLSGAGSTLDDTGNLYLGGALYVIHGSQATFAGSVNIFDQSSITVDPTAEMEVGGSDNLSTGSIEVDPTYSMSGSGEVTASIANNGQIIAANSDETLTLDGAVTGTGIETIDNNATLELEGSVGKGQTISFADATGTLILDDPNEFSGTIEGIQVGDSIVLANTGAATDNGVISANIGTYLGIQTLQLLEGTTTNPLEVFNTYHNFRINAIGSTFSPPSNYYFQVSQNFTSTALTLEQGNPIALSVGAPTVWQEFGDEGAGIKVGVISDSINSDGYALPSNVTVLPGFSGPTQAAGATDEGLAMAEVIDDIAPGASIEFATGFTSADKSDQTTMSEAIGSLVAAGCSIIVDDVVFNSVDEPNSGTPVENAIDAAVKAKVTYVTAAGNNNEGAGIIFGHATDLNAITVAAMNILATPSQFGGYISPEQTEPFSNVGTVPEKPDITGPDGGATSLPLLEPYKLNPFFGTSAAAPAVAAVAALMMSENQSLTASPSAVKQLLEDSAAPFGEPSNKMGAGFVQAPQAVMKAADYVQCYAAGTRILCDDNETDIEQLRAGDRVRARFGGLSPIGWIGRRYVDCRRHSSPDKVWPVRVQAGALGKYSPERDLWLSPDHAVFLCDVLIPIKLLINGTSIVQVKTDDITYYHIELAEHDLIIAEGLYAETYLDLGDRPNFENGATVLRLNPDFSEHRLHCNAIWEMYGCAPMVVSGAKLDAVRRWVNARITKIKQDVNSAA